MLLKPHEAEWLQSKFHSSKKSITIAWHWIFKRRDPIIIATIATAFGTLALALVALLQIKEMVDEQRPWIYAEIERTRPSITILGPDLNFGFKLSLTNIGHRPAVNVAISSAVWPLVASTAKERNARVAKACHEQESTFANVGEILFPNQTVKPWAGFQVFMRTEDLVFKGHPLRSMAPFVVACVLYRDTQGKLHHTPYAFFIGTPNVDVPGIGEIPTDLNALASVEVGIVPDDNFLGNPD